MTDARSYAPLVVLLLALVALLAAARRTEIYQSIEARTLDWRFKRLADPQHADPDIVLAMLDQKTLDYFETQQVYWPWPRSIYNAVLDLCRAGGARAVVFDVLFTNPCPYGASEDQAFGAMLRKTPRAVLAMELSRSANPIRATAPPASLAVATVGDATSIAVPKRSAHLPIPELLGAVQFAGDVETKPDADGIFRRVSLLTRMDGRFYPTLPLAVAMALTGTRKVEVRPGQLALGKRAIPLIDGRMLIHFHGSALSTAPPGGRHTYAAYSLGNLILSWQRLHDGKRPLYDPAVLKDKIVFVGLSAAGLLDNRPSPIAAVFPGTEVVAAAVDTIMQGDFILPVRGPWVLAVLALAVLAGAVATSWPKRLWASIAILVVAAGALLSAAVFLFTRGMWLDIVAPQLGLVLGFTVTSTYNYLREGRRKRFIQNAFSHYLSADVVEQIIRSPGMLALGGEKRDLTVFFSDIAGFTTISESLEPDQLVRLINRYLGAMTEIILELGGTLDKYEGDAIMAFWGAPVSHPDHAARACRAALENRRRLRDLRAEFAREGLPRLDVRIGLNSGICSVGNMGSERRFDYTAMGDHVNLASRLEGANKMYGTYLMISEFVVERAAPAIEVRELDFIKVKGKATPIRVYELLGLKGETGDELLRRARLFEEGLALYRARHWDRATAAFQLVLDEFPDDTPSRVFLDRCARYREAPPLEDWDGSYTLTTK